MFLRQCSRTIFFLLFCLAIGSQITKLKRIPNSTTFSLIQEDMKAPPKPLAPTDRHFANEANPNITVTIDNNNSTTNSSSSNNTTDLSNPHSNSCLSAIRGEISLLNRKNRQNSSKSSSEYLYLDFALREVYSLPETPDKTKILVTSDGESFIPATHMITTEDGEIYLVSSLQGARELICSQK